MPNIHSSFINKMESKTKHGSWRSWRRFAFATLAIISMFVIVKNGVFSSSKSHESNLGANGASRNSNNSRTSARSTNHEMSEARKQLLKRALPRDVSDVLDLHTESQQTGFDTAQLWEKIQSRSMSATQRKALRYRVLVEMSSQFGCDKALQFLNEKVGPGSDRQYLIVAAFETATKDPQSAVAALKHLQLPEEEAIFAYRAMSRSIEFSDGDYQSLLNALPSKVIPYCIEGVTKSQVGKERYKDANSEERMQIIQNSLNQICQLNLNNSEKAALYDSCVKSLSGSDPEVSWKIVSNLSDSSIATKQTMSDAVVSFVGNNPEQGFKSLLEYQGNYRSELIIDAVFSMASQNMDKVNDLIANPSVMGNQKNSDPIAVAMARYAGLIGDKPTSVKWVESIRDQDLKAKTLKEVGGLARR